MRSCPLQRQGTSRQALRPGAQLSPCLVRNRQALGVSAQLSHSVRRMRTQALGAGAQPSWEWGALWVTLHVVTNNCPFWQGPLHKGARGTMRPAAPYTEQLSLHRVSHPLPLHLRVMLAVTIVARGHKPARRGFWVLTVCGF